MSDVLLERAIQSLAGICDGANKKDDVGFNKPDSHLGHYLAHIPVQYWSDSDKYAAYDMLYKYQDQLYKTFSLNYQNISPHYRNYHTGNVNNKPTRLIDFKENQFILTFQYNPFVIEAIKQQFQNSRFQSEILGNYKHNYWTIPNNYNNQASLEKFIKEYDFVASEKMQQFLTTLNNNSEIFSSRSSILPNISQEEKPQENKITLELYKEAIVFAVQFDYPTQKLLDIVRNVPGRRYNTATREWFLPQTYSGAHACIVLKEEYKFIISNGVYAEIHAVYEETSEIQQLSSASEIKNDSFNYGKYEDILRPYQKVAVQYVLKTQKTLICDSMGCGKSLESLAAIDLAQAYPLLIVCPSSLKYMWKAEILKFVGNNHPINILKSRNAHALEYVEDNSIIILNYDIFSAWFDVLSEVKFKAIILDESSAICNLKAQRTKALLQTKVWEGVQYKICLTGTPIKNHTGELIPQLEFLDRLQSMGGYKYVVHANPVKLHEKLREICYIRRTKAEVLPELPDKQYTTIPIDISNNVKYQLAEKDFVAWLTEKKQVCYTDIGYDELYNKTKMKSLQAETLVRLNVLRQAVAEAKQEAAYTFISSVLNNNEKLVVFGIHGVMIDKLFQTYREHYRISSQDSAEKRHNNVINFQNDPQAKAIICAMGATVNACPGGIGITLTSASNCLFTEYGWTTAHMDQCEDRLHRLGQTRGVNIYYLHAENSIDNFMVKLLEQKKEHTTAMIDGEKGVELLQLVEHVFLGK